MSQGCKKKKNLNSIEEKSCEISHKRPQINYNEEKNLNFKFKKPQKILQVFHSQILSPTSRLPHRRLF